LAGSVSADVFSAGCRSPSAKADPTKLHRDIANRTPSPGTPGEGWGEGAGAAAAAAAARVIVVATLALAALAGCARPAGVVFPPLAQPIVWPPAPERARVRYVGQLTTEADLKPAVPFGQQLGQVLFGKREVRSMLTPFAVCTDGGD